MLYEYKKMTREEMDALLPKKEEIVLSSHGDADGISSAVLVSYRYKIAKLNFPDVFGQVIGDEDLMVDMSPSSQFGGLVIDHHPPTITEAEVGKERTIIWGEEPASRIAFEVFKPWIPKEAWWKMVVGMVGDGQAEKTPTEVWESCKGLLDEWGSFVSSKGNDYYFSSPVWLQLSSGINALARTGWREKAFDVLKEASSPLDVLQNPFVQEYKSKLLTEEMRIIKETKPVDLGHVLFWPIETRYAVNGLMASKLNAIKKKTSIVLNTADNTFSVRGVLASLVKERVTGIARVGGHPGYMGGSLNPGISLSRLMEELRRV